MDGAPPRICLFVCLFVCSCYTVAALYMKPEIQTLVLLIRQIVLWFTSILIIYINLYIYSFNKKYIHDFEYSLNERA